MGRGRIIIPAIDHPDRIAAQIEQSSECAGREVGTPIPIIGKRQPDTIDRLGQSRLVVAFDLELILRVSQMLPSCLQYLESGHASTRAGSRATATSSVNASVASLPASTVAIALSNAARTEIRLVCASLKS